MLTACILFVSLYIHGGRDLKEGAMSSLWRVNLTKVHAMDEDPYLTVEWEPVKTVGGDIGKISHHSAIVCAPNKVIFYGGLVGEDSNDKVYLFDLVKHSWSQIPLKVSMSNALLDNDEPFGTCCLTCSSDKN